MARVALAQFSGNESKEINVQKAEALAREAAGNGAKIVCFPELSTTTYFCYERNSAFFALAEPVPGPSVDRLRKLARETGTVLVYPLYENDGGTLYNTAVVIGPDGELIGYFGTARFIDPRRAVMGRAGDKEDEILYAEIDPRVCDDVRDLWGFLKFRRPDAYNLVVGDAR